LLPTPERYEQKLSVIVAVIAIEIAAFLQRHALHVTEIHIRNKIKS
jgi:hypothetical protein